MKWNFATIRFGLTERGMKMENYKKFLVQVWEKRAIYLEVEAKDEADAKLAAEDAYVNNDNFQEDMVSNDDNVTEDGFVVLKELGGADGTHPAKRVYNDNNYQIPS